MPFNALLVLVVALTAFSSLSTVATAVLQEHSEEGSDRLALLLPRHEAHHEHQALPSSATSAIQSDHLPIPYIPTAEEIGLDPIVVPKYIHLRKGSHDHFHAHSGAVAEVHLNETKLLLAKGPEPLSYIEWDFSYEMGTVETLRRFVSPAYLDLDNGTGVMGIVDGPRYRQLFDQRDLATRKTLAQDLLSRVGTTQEPIEPSRHRWLMTAHIVGASLSCFVLLPLALFLRAADSSLSPLIWVLYIALLTASLLISSLYKALTPRLYPKNSHAPLGWTILWLSILCLGGDLRHLLRSATMAVKKSASGDHKARTLFHSVLNGSQDEEEEMQTFLGPGKSVEEQHPLRVGAEGSDGSSDSLAGRSNSPASTPVGSSRDSQQQEPVLKYKPTSSPDSSPSAGYGHDQPTSSPFAPQRSRLKAILYYTHLVVTRSLPCIAFAALYSGLAVYTGSCRSASQNTCLAHGVKGGLFFWYGLMTFARILGAYADIGWSWNRRPDHHSGSSRVPSAEWVECAIIFTYGISNTWLERLDAQTGDPYTVKQIQHISIAVMYWFSGVVGLILETRSLRDLLNIPIVLGHPLAKTRMRSSGQHSSGDPEALLAAQQVPHSYSFSFNPFFAICIGLTGLVMASHHQDYLYQVEVHTLWGRLLAAFALLRCCTYFFLWLRPPTISILPSRPPTELVASFVLTMGGLVFMISSEDVTYAAMRHGYGDIMAVLCISTAVICLVFAGVTSLMIIKAWAVKRESRRRREKKMRGRSFEGQSYEDEGPALVRPAAMSSQGIFVLADQADEEAAQV